MLLPLSFTGVFERIRLRRPPIGRAVGDTRMPTLFLGLTEISAVFVALKPDSTLHVRVIDRHINAARGDSILCEGERRQR
jgi:hypothetical protein